MAGEIRSKPDLARNAFSLIGLFLPWALYPLLGLPLPYMDDLFYSGPAVALIQGKGLVNPWLRGQFPGLDNFLVYPPGYFLILAAYLKLTGVSVLALSGFFMVLGLAVGGCLLSMTRRLALPDAIALGLNLVIALNLIYTGFRPELAAIFFLCLAGRLLIERNSTFWRTGGLFCLGWACASAPAIMGFAFAIGAAALLASAKPPSQMWRFWCALGLAIMAFAVTFMFSLGFAFEEFLNAFLTHGGRRQALSYYNYPVVLVVLGASLLRVLLYDHRRPASAFQELIRMDPVMLLGSVILAGLMLQAVLHAREQVISMAAQAVLFLLAASLARQPAALTPFYRLIAVAGAMILVLGPHLNMVSYVTEVERLPVGEGAPPIKKSIAAHLQNGGRLFVDPYCFRQIYDAAPPFAAIDWSFQKPFPNAMPRTLEERDAGDLWCVSPFNLWTRFPHEVPVERVPVLAPGLLYVVDIRGVTFPRRAWEIYLIGDGENPFE